MKPEDLHTDLDDFANHGDIDDDRAAIEIIDEYIFVVGCAHSEPMQNCRST